MLECAFNSNEKITSFRRTRNLQDSYLESLTNSICFLRKKKEKQWTQLDIHCIKILFEYASAQDTERRTCKYNWRIEVDACNMKEEIIHEIIAR